MRRSPFPVLLLTNSILVVALAWLWFQPDGSLKNTEWKTPAVQRADYLQMIPDLPHAGGVDTSKFVAMLERPLFMLSRRPPPPPPPPDVPAPVDTLSTARLSGVFNTDKGGGVVISIGGKDRRVRINEVIEGGWSLKSISGNTATFSAPGQTRTLVLPRAALTGAGVPAAIHPPPSSSTVPPSAAPPQSNQVAQPSNAPSPVASPAGASKPAAPRAVFGGSR